MTLSQLRRQVFGRAIRPYALAVSCSTLTIGVAVLEDAAIGKLLDEWPGTIIGIMAIASVLLLWWGWWRKSEKTLALGLLWSAGVWSGVGAVLMLEGGAWVSAILAWCWVIGSGGAWLIERDELRGR